MTPEQIERIEERWKTRGGRLVVMDVHTGEAVAAVHDITALVAEVRRLQSEHALLRQALDSACKLVGAHFGGNDVLMECVDEWEALIRGVTDREQREERE